MGTTGVLVSAQDFVPGPKISTLAEKAVVFSLPSWPPLGYPAGSLLGAAGCSMGSVTIGHPGGLASAEPKTALRQPSRQANALG
jgi:hypothetical protein